MADSITVTQLVRRMRNLLEIEVGEVWVEGEISNLRRQASGHNYFSIKDDSAQLPCALFKGRAKNAGKLLEDGVKVRLFGEVTMYEQQGRAQLIVQKVEPIGKGDLQAQFEALKQKLKGEGLFDSEHKKVLPSFPKKIALVTSPSGAALQDMLNVFERRAPWVQLYIVPVQVQGHGAEKGIARAINALSHWEDFDLPEVDLIITGRGGGSIEDLWNFNEEILARAIYKCPIPVISAVGHEIDFTIADFVADERAPTPSAAAEIATPDQGQLLNDLAGYRNLVSREVKSQFDRYEQLIDFYHDAIEMRSPDKVVEQYHYQLQESREALTYAVANQLERRETLLHQCQRALQILSPLAKLDRFQEKIVEMKESLAVSSLQAIERKENELAQFSRMLRSLGPESTLARGYSLSLNAEGEVISQAKQIESGERLTTRFADGEIHSVVE